VPPQGFWIWEVIEIINHFNKDLPGWINISGKQLGLIKLIWPPQRESKPKAGITLGSNQR
jgi:hypothetical protein